MKRVSFHNATLMLHYVKDIPQYLPVAIHGCNGYVASVDQQLYRATAQVIGEVGWDALTLDRVAERVGKSRVTLWRNGITRESLLDGLLRQLSDDYRDQMLPIMVATLPPRERFEKAMYALCDVVDKHADLLSVSDDMFHRAYAAGAVPLGFLDPFLQAIREARAAGVLRGPAKASRARDIEMADVAFNTIAWPYLHFRVRHEWPAKRARKVLVATILDGMMA
jgi:AcrR family transcriptional regulator